MIKHLSFYTRQALSNIKRSIFIILGLSIAISMIAGLQFYFDSSEELAIRNSYTRMDDFDISFTTNEINFISSYYKRNSVLNAIQSSKLDLESKTDYLIMYSPQNAGYKIFRNFSDNQELLDLGLESIDTSLLKLAFFGNDFYSSNRFDQYINIINGTYPMNQNEVLIESSFARNFNLSVGMVTNFTIKIPFETFENETYSQYYRYNYSIDEMEISGIYKPILSNFNFNKISLFEASSSLGEDDNSIVASEFDNPVIFSWFNFSSSKNDHPAQLFYRKLMNSHETLIYSIKLNTGMMLFYNRQGINLDNINSFLRVINEQTLIMERNLPSSTHLQHSFSQSLTLLLENTSYLRFSMQIINLPIIVFALIIGAFSTKINIKSRLEEFLLLRSKGTPQKVISFQILTEAIINGIISSILGVLIGGFIMINLFNTWFTPLYGGYPSQFGNVFTFLLRWTTIVEILILGVILTVLSSLTSILYISKLKISTVLKTLDQGEMEDTYDETSIYRNISDQTIKTQRKITEIKYQAREKTNQSDGFALLIFNRENYLKKKKKRRSKEDIYEEAFDIQSKKIRKWSIFYILLALIPIIIYIIILSSENPTAPDNLIQIGEYLKNGLLFYPIFTFLLFLSPYFLAAGIIRILTKESPSIFALLSRKISSIFLRAKSYLVGMEMVKRKQFATIIFVLGVFSSLITFLNVLSNTTLRSQIIVSNSNIGSDLKMPTQFQGIINSNTHLFELENDLLSIRNEDNQSIINQVTILHQESLNWGFQHTDYSPQDIFFVNFSEYFGIVSEGNKIPPNIWFESSIREAIYYNDIPSNNHLGAIVSRSVLSLNNLKIGDFIKIGHYYYDVSADEERVQIIFAKIVQVMDVMPGIYNSIFTWGSTDEKIVLDIGILSQNENFLHSEDSSLLIDLNLETESDQTIIKSYIENATENSIDISDMEFYEQRWNDLNYNPIGGLTGISGTIGIINLIFIIIGTQLGFGLAVFISASQKDNRIYTGILLSRGFGKRGIFKFILSQFVIIFLISFVAGITSGYITSIGIMNLLNILSPTTRGFHIPIFFNGFDLFAVLGSITGISFAIFMITYIFEMRKSIADYMHKF